MSASHARACLLAMLLGALACAEERPPEPIRPVLSVVVGGPKGIDGRWWPGRAKATLEVDLGFEVSGQLIERSANVGDEVEAGTVMARLDPRDYENVLLRAKAERERAAALYERVEIAARTGAVSRQDLDDARARLDQAEAQVRIRQKAVDDCRIVAPFDGLVSATFVDNFQNVRVKQPVIRFLDVSKLEMIINIPENLINLSQHVKDISVRFDALPGVDIPARIKEIGREASEATRTFPLTLIFDAAAAGAKVQPGMAGEATGRVELPEDLREGGVEVPSAAVFTPVEEQSQASYVWIVDEESSTVSRRAVEPGAITLQGGTLVKGVEPGERVVTAGVHRLHEGQQVLVP
ncbi:MAG: efflux RND transporter periplasmic adaptor subunit [Myxococcota bacterium]|nr:efflux RND transporter periplasmic adaptor subunit [Myxococcota bacterium]